MFGKINKHTKFNFYICFQPKQTYWLYILSNPFLNDLTNPIVIDEDGIEEFSAPVIINLFKKSILTITSKSALLLSKIQSTNLSSFKIIME